MKEPATKKTVKDVADSKSSKKKSDTEVSKKATKSKETTKKKLYKIVHCDASGEWVDAKTAAIYEEEHEKELAYLKQQQEKEAKERKAKKAAQKRGTPTCLRLVLKFLRTCK